MSSYIKPTSSTQSSLFQKIKDIDENFLVWALFFLILLIVVCLILYILYLSRLEASECSYMDKLYGKLDSHIHSITSANKDFSGNLNDYYIKTAYNACSGGSYKNDYVDLCNLKSVLKQGVRGLDFEIYSIQDQPVVATSTMDSVYIKETFNSVPFLDVMKTIESYAFSNSTSPNPSDPIILHLRMMSNNQEMYTQLAKIFESYEKWLLGKEYSYENYGVNLGGVPLLRFLGKIIVIVDRSNQTFLQNKELLEFVNMTSNSVFMRALTYYDVKYSPDITELQDFNKLNMTIVLPDQGADPINPNAIVSREAGCQMVAMRYQKVDDFLEENTAFFDNVGYAFVLKPENLRYNDVTIPDDTQEK